MMNDSPLDADGFKLNYIVIWPTVCWKSYHALEASSGYSHFSSVGLVNAVKDNYKRN